jgi:hypothetical protein
MLRRFSQVLPPVIVLFAVNVVDLFGRVFARHHFPDDTMNCCKAAINPNLAMPPAINSADLFAGVSRIVDFVGSRRRWTLLPG